MSVGAEQVQAVIEPDVARAGGRVRRLSGLDKLTLVLMCGIPFLLQAAFVWFPTFSSIGLSFTSWEGIGGKSKTDGVGTPTSPKIFTISPPFWPALRHNVIWL